MTIRTGRLRAQTAAPRGSGRGERAGRVPVGFPSVEDVRLARDDEEFERAVTAYRFWYPTVSMEGVFNGRRQAGVRDNREVMLMVCGPRHVLFTAGSDAPFAGTLIDLTDGPVVVELPPGPFIGLAMDRHQRWLMDMGLCGPDAGDGGRHVLLPPDFADQRPDATQVARSTSFQVSLALRALPRAGDVGRAMDALRAVRIYPLASAADPALFEFVDVSDKPLDATPLRWEDGLGFWEKLHGVIEREAVVDEFRPMYGLLSALGIEKDRPFTPNIRLKAMLAWAAKTGRDQMIAAAFDSPRADRLVWKDRRWEWAALASEGSDFETPHGLDLEARDRWFVQAFAMSPTMLLRGPGAGSIYWLGHRDRYGEYLNGSAGYRLAVPLPVPAGLFWSVTVYDAATRSQIRTEQDRAALRSLFELADLPESGEAELRFGPEPPGDDARYWIRTIPGRGWFAYLRIYGPQAPAFDGRWKPGDFEPLR